MIKNSKYWFLLGREPKISAAEITAVLKLSDSTSTMLSENILTTKAEVEPKLINRLGGTIKIGIEIGTKIRREILIETIVTELLAIDGKINFGISDYSEKLSSHIESLVKQIKLTLKNSGRSVRYVRTDKDGKISSATVYHNNLTTKGREFLIAKDGGGFSVAKTLAVQPFEALGRRDFGRPGRDDKSGMLPPKLAMILINLSQASTNDVILDPFCGSGTILTEAMLMGYQNLIGTDISEKAISDTKQNLEWVNKISDFRFQISDLRIECCEINDLDKLLPKQSVDTIVTEPYLGKPLSGRESQSELEIQSRELGKLYVCAFQKFANVLKKNTAIIFIIPRFLSYGKWLTINCSTEIEKFGFKVIPLQTKEPYLLYGRPGQRVMREIWKFRKV